MATFEIADNCLAEQHFIVHTHGSLSDLFSAQSCAALLFG